MQDTKEESLRRLAILETTPIRTPSDLLEWNELRLWVINEGLVEEFRDQAYFAQSNEITKVETPPLPKSYWSRLLSLISK